MGTAVTISIESGYVSNYVTHAETWHDANAVGRFSIILNNTSNIHSGAFTVNDAVEIDVGGATIIEGWVDSVHPVGLSSPDVFTQKLEITGRDFGRELVDLTADKPYTYWPGDSIIADLLSITSSNITYTTISGATSLSYDSKNEYLLNSFRTICERTGQDFYVDDDSALQLFDAGSQESSIVLQSVAGGGTNNNILRFERDSAEGTDIKNYIVIRGKQVEDGWTEYNASDWIVPTNGTASNDGTTYYKGVYSIKYTRGSATDSYLRLSFDGGKYGYSNLDWSKISAGELSFYIYFPTGSTSRASMLRLTDTSNNVIVIAFEGFYEGEVSSHDTWLPFTFEVGKTVKINDFYSDIFPPKPVWCYETGTSFTWIIKSIEVNINSSTSFYLDGLKVPNRMLSVDQDSGSQNSYGIRHIIIDKLDLESQVELDAYSARYLLLHKDPMTKLTIVAKGTAGITGIVNNWNPGYNVTVNIPGEGINSVSYRMMSIHHVFDTDNTTNGFDFYTVLELVPAADSLNIRRFEAQTRDVSLLRELREMISVLQQEENLDTDQYPVLPEELGKHYLISAIQYDEYWQAEESPVVMNTGTAAFVDITASKGSCARRLSTAASAEMLDIHTSVPTMNEYVVSFRLKVTSNASTNTLATIQIYDETAASTVTSFNITPSMFTANDTWQQFSIKGTMKSATSYSFSIVSFVTGITDLFCDWISITDSPIAADTVTTWIITNGAVTAPKLGDYAVTSGKISFDAVYGDLIASGTITIYNLAADSVGADQIIAGSIQTVNLAAGSVTAEIIAADAVYSISIQANAITAVHVSANAITANAIAANTVTANHIQANAVTTNKVIGQAISIDKLATNVGAPGIQFLYTKFAEYSTAPSTVMEQAWGVNSYMRTIAAENQLKYHVRRVEFETGVHDGFIDVYIVQGAISGLIRTAIFTSGVANVHDLFQVEGYDVGTKDFTVVNNALNIKYTTLNSGCTYANNGIRIINAGGGSFDKFKAFTYYSSTLWTTKDFTPYDYLGIALNNSTISSQVTVRVQLGTDTSGENYYYKDIEIPDNPIGTSQIRGGELIRLSGMAIVGSPSLTNINRIDLIQQTSNPWVPRNAYIDATWFGLVKADWAYCFVENSGGATYNEYGQDLSFVCDKSSDVRIYYCHALSEALHSNMRYPASDVRGASYLMDADTI